MINESAAFILHRHNYGESSRILRCLTRDHGRVDVLCKGCRSAGKRSRALEPFRQYQLSWHGKNDLKTLRQVDELGHYPLQTDAEKLYCGFYLNELLSQVTRHGEVEPVVYDLYVSTLAQLAALESRHIQGAVRLFELSLLRCMGYGVNLDTESDGMTQVHEARSYGFEPDHGLYRTDSESQRLARGDAIIALNQGRFENARQEKEAKHLMRAILHYYLPNSSIQSRQLFI